MRSASARQEECASHNADNAGNAAEAEAETLNAEPAASDSLRDLPEFVGLG